MHLTVKVEIHFESVLLTETVHTLKQTKKCICYKYNENRFQPPAEFNTTDGEVDLRKGSAKESDNYSHHVRSASDSK